MPEDPKKKPSREELPEARRELERQIEIVRNPVLGRDCNPQLVARLEAMGNEIDECLAAMEAA